MKANTIDEAISYMDDIVAWSKAHNSRAGYFAALYRKVTIKIKQEIEAGGFDDNPRMETFDVIFANRYLKAFTQWRDGKNPSMVWQTTFHAVDEWRPLVIQQLFLGMNAHINLDLGIAAARTASGDALPSLKNDFNKINDVLASLVDSVIDELSKIWPPLKLLTLSKVDDVLVNFSMSKARDQAWALAEVLAPLGIADQEYEIRDKDYEMAKLGMLIANPGFVVNTVMLPIRIGERGTIQQKIDVLSQPAEKMKTAELNLLFDF
mgnify:FL=1